MVDGVTIGTSGLQDVRFGFVILHYLVDDATTECVESIHAHCKEENYHIVIVDNNSANGSFERLEQRFVHDDRVTLIHNDRNEGFARGNAVGYRYCRTVLHCNYIATINNDAVLVSDNFITQSVADYESGRYGVIGPDIVSGKDESHQNPMRDAVDSREKLQVIQNEVNRELRLRNLHLLEPIRLVKRIVRPTRSQVEPMQEAQHKQPTPVPEELHGDKLHGSCLIFTPSFVKHFAEPFDTRTFLYVEEDILYMRCQQAGLTMYYDPSIVVRHAEDVSTEASVQQDDDAKRVQFLKNSQASLKILKQYLN